MLEENTANGEPRPSSTARIREILARNIAARNHGISQEDFFGAVNTLVSSLVAARIFEEAGIFRYGLVREQTGKLGLSGGLYSLFGDISPVNISNHTGNDGGTGSLWPDLRACRTVSVDHDVTGRLLDLTHEKQFSDEYPGAGPERRELFLLSFLSQSAHLSHGGRMVVAGQEPLYRGLDGPVIPAFLLDEAAEEIILARLSGKTPKTAALRLIDPTCRTGRVLLAMYRVLSDWHRSWYQAHLVPLLIEGRDPASRKVQALIPPVTVKGISSGDQRFGTSPLPVCRCNDGSWDLTCDEKVRILAESLYGVDNDPAAVEVTRLSVLAHILSGQGDSIPGSHCLTAVRTALTRNIRCGNILIGKDYEPQPSLAPERRGNQPVRGISIAEEFPHVISGGGFDIVMSTFPALLPFYGAEVKDYLCRHYHSGKPGDATPYHMESAILLTRPGGICCGFMTGGWLRSRDAAPFREWLAGYHVERITYLGNLPSFAGIHDPLMVTIINGPPILPAAVREVLKKGNEIPANNMFRLVTTADLTTLGHRPWIFSGVPASEVRKKIDSAGAPLSRYILGEYITREKDENPVLIVSRQEYHEIRRKDPVMGKFLYPCVSEEDVKRYSRPVYSYYIVCIPPGMTRKLAGDVHDAAQWFHTRHRTFAEIIRKYRPRQHGAGNGRPYWWEWQQPGAHSVIEPPVLLTRASGHAGGPGWMVAYEKVYPGAGVLVIPCHDPSLAGILNSRLAHYYILSSARKKGMHGYLPTHIMRFPVVIPDPDPAADNKPFRELAILVEKRQALEKAADESGTPGEAGATRKRVRSCEQDIDTLVYELYGLSAGEIASIENWMAEAEERGDTP